MEKKITCGKDRDGDWYAYCHADQTELGFASGKTKEAALENLANKLYRRLLLVHQKLIETIP